MNQGTRDLTERRPKSEPLAVPLVRVQTLAVRLLLTGLNRLKGLTEQSRGGQEVLGAEILGRLPLTLCVAPERMGQLDTVVRPAVYSNARKGAPGRGSKHVLAKTRRGLLAFFFAPFFVAVLTVHSFAKKPHPEQLAKPCMDAPPGVRPTRQARSPHPRYFEEVSSRIARFAL